MAEWKAPVALPLPVPWALGLSWRLRTSGVWVHARPPRIWIMRLGQLVGAWLGPHDPILTPGSIVHSIVQLHAHLWQKPVPSAVSEFFSAVEILRTRIGAEHWQTLLLRMLRDALRVQDPIVWHAAELRAIPEPTAETVWVPELLWQLVTTAPSEMEQCYREARSGLLIPAAAEWQTLLRQWCPSADRADRLIDEVTHAGDPLATIFGSLFALPRPRTRPSVPEHAIQPEPSRETPASACPILLETLQDDWETLRVYARQSRLWDHYRVLGVSRDADEETIRSRYRLLARTYHPDRWAGADVQQQEIVRQLFARIEQAYTVLSDPGQRRAYDHELQAAQGPKYEVVHQREGRVDPSVFRHYFLKGLHAWVRNQPEEAVRWLQSARSGLEDWRVELLLALAEGWCKDRTMLQQSRQRLERLIREYPKNARIWWVYAAALYHWGYRKRARQAVDTVRTLQPSLLDTWGDPAQPSFRRKPFVEFFRDFARGI